MMNPVRAGDIVRHIHSKNEMLVIGQDYDAPELGEKMWICAWEDDKQLHEHIYQDSKLIVVRKERRRIPRGGPLHIPVNLDSVPQPSIVE